MAYSKNHLMHRLLGLWLDKVGKVGRKSCCPASVSDTLRVVRLNRRKFSRVSKFFHAMAQRRRRNPQKLPRFHKTLRLRQRQKIIQFVKVLHFLFKLSFISEFNSLHHKS